MITIGRGIKILVEADYALFTIPTIKAEKVSYDFITPSAARAIIQNIYWKPQLSYKINKIQVLNEPEFTTIKRNELVCKMSSSDARKLMNGSRGKGYVLTSEHIQQRSATILKNVKYVIEVEFVMTGINSTKDDTPAKHYNMLLRRLRNGQYFRSPYAGCREFPVRVSLIEEDDNTTYESEIKGRRDYGFMLYDMDYSDLNNIQPMFFRAIMQDGVLDLSNVEIVR